MNVVEFLLIAIVTVVLPPVGVWLAGGTSLQTGVSLILFLLGQIVFWGFYALPGLAIWGLSLALALLFMLLSRSRRTKAAA